MEPLDEEEAESLTAAAGATRDRMLERYPIERGEAFAALIEEGTDPIHGCGWAWVNRALYGDPWAESESHLRALQDTIDEILDSQRLNNLLQDAMHRLQALEDVKPDSELDRVSATDLIALHEVWTSILRARVLVSADSLAKREPESLGLALKDDGYEGFPLQQRVFHFIRRVFQNNNEAFLYRNPKTGKPDPPSKAVMMMWAWVEVLEENFAEAARRYK